MKLRFDHQSIRLRVRKSDIAKLTEAGFVEEKILFPQGVLAYKLEISQDSQLVSSEISGHTITVRIPAAKAMEWINSEDVGIYASQPTGQTENLLEILIEKDFPCKHGSTADNADSFEELDKS